MRLLSSATQYCSLSAPPMKSHTTTTTTTTSNSFVSSPSHKRRKLASSTANASARDSVLKTSQDLYGNGIGTAYGAALGVQRVAEECASCHRAFHTTAVLAACSRCAAPSCAICSRTCTRSLPSLPSTPHLTFSPTPSPPPRRMALAPSSACVNIHTSPRAPDDAWFAFHTHAHSPNRTRTPNSTAVFDIAGVAAADGARLGASASVSGKRKKAHEDEGWADDVLLAEDAATGTHRDAHGAGVDGRPRIDVAVAQGYMGDGGGPGCGRMLCKACCFEDSKNNTTTCLDCYGS